MSQQEYIEMRMAEFAMNIDEFQVGEIVLDSDKSRCEITNKTINTIEVFMRKKTPKGIDCTQWFDMKQFNKRFTKS